MQLLGCPYQGRSLQDRSAMCVRSRELERTTNRFAVGRINREQAFRVFFHPEALRVRQVSGTILSHLYRTSMFQILHLPSLETVAALVDSQTLLSGQVPSTEIVRSYQDSRRAPAEVDSMHRSRVTCCPPSSASPRQLHHLSEEPSTDHIIASHGGTSRS